MSSIFSLPDQTISESKKDKEWHMQHPRNYAAFSLSPKSGSQKENMLKYYRAYNAELSEKELEATKRITCPNGKDLGIEYIVYPLIQTKIEQIVGEFMSRPIRRKAYVIDKKSKAKKLEEKLKMVSEDIMRDLAKKMKDDLGFEPQTENFEMELPEDVEEFFEKDFKMLAEEVADKIINLFLDVNKHKEKLKEYFIDYCITDRAHSVFFKKDNHTTARKAHPLDVDHDLNPYEVVQRDHEYFFENWYLSENEIYNTFTLSPTQKAGVKEMFEALSGNFDSTDHQSDDLGNTIKYDGWYDTNNKAHRIRLVNAMWKSREIKTIKISNNKNTGEKIYKVLKDEDKPRKKDKTKTVDREVSRFCIMLGPNICLDYGKMEDQLTTVTNPYRTRLPVISIVRDNSIGTSTVKSVAAKLYQLQELASEALFELRLALKHAGDSRVLVYDVAQTPKDFTKGGFQNGVNRVMSHIKKDKIMFINSGEKKAANRNGFNQFTSLDLSQNNTLKSLLDGIVAIEDLASKFVGISPEREGNVGQYQTASGTNAAVKGSYARTEVIYTPFDEFVQAMLDMVLMKAKHDYEDGEVIQYVFGEMKTRFIKLYKEFFEADFGIYLSDARKDKEAAERINAAAELALSSANTPDMVMGLIEVFEGDTAVEKKAVFQRMLNAMDKQREAAEQAAQEQAKAEMEQEAAAKAEESKLKREGYDKDIDVAKIYAANKAMSDNTKATSQERIKAAEIEAQKEKEPASAE